MFEQCPCGSGASYLACCARLHSGQAEADTAEALIRARYSAYARGDAAYLWRSWAPETRPARIDLEPERAWTGLAVEDVRVDGEDRAVVRFSARWRRGAQTGRLSETSRFRRDNGVWRYVDGQVRRSNPTRRSG